MSELVNDPFSALFAEFEAELKSASPNLDAYLEKIRKDTAETPELVWKLTPEQIGLIVTGLAKVARVEIATATKGKAKKKDLDALEGMLDLMAMENNGSVIPKQKTAAETKAALDLFGGLKLNSVPLGTKPPWKK